MVLDIQDPYAAYCLDEACMAFGSYIQSELDQVTGKNDKEIQGRRTLKMKALLDDNPEARYATPFATM